jgi:hypothetical protein
MEGSGRGQIKVLPWRLPGRTEELLDSHCPDRDSNRVHTEHESRVLLLW